MASKAGLTLWRARLFLDQARAAHHDWERFAANYEAAVVFSRSVTLHLQAEYGRQPDFSAWYEQIRTQLGKDEVARFFLESRNIILHRGPVALVQFGSFTVHDAAVGVEEARVDKYDEPEQPVPAEWAGAERQWAGLNRLGPIEVPPASVEFSYHHWDSPAADGQDAAALLSSYLDTLEEIVRAAEERWGEDRRCRPVP